jgi:hypothetical protein
VLSVSHVMRSGVLNENTEVFSDGPVSDMPAATSPITIEQDAGGAPAAFTQPLAERAQVPAALEEVVVNARSLESAFEGDVVTTSFDCADVDTEIAEDWLACIATGVEQGRIDAARQELEAFLVIYPEYSLPEELDILQ